MNTIDTITIDTLALDTIVGGQALPAGARQNTQGRWSVPDGSYSIRARDCSPGVGATGPGMAAHEQELRGAGWNVSPPRGQGCDFRLTRP